MATSKASNERHTDHPFLYVPSPWAAWAPRVAQSEVGAKARLWFMPHTDRGLDNGPSPALPTRPQCSGKRDSSLGKDRLSDSSGALSSCFQDRTRPMASPVSHTPGLSSCPSPRPGRCSAAQFPSPPPCVLSPSWKGCVPASWPACNPLSALLLNGIFQTLFGHSGEVGGEVKAWAPLPNQ